MIDPASLADWTQASLVAALLGGLGAACGWAPREEQRERLVTARRWRRLRYRLGQHSNTAGPPEQSRPLAPRYFGAAQNAISVRARSL
jgi:hypothetical protein